MNREIKFRAWDGDTKLGYKQHGYQKRKADEHPFADKRGYVMEHRLVMENHIGRYLPKNAIIHHKNHVRDDNRIENLEYMEEQERHAKHHDSGKRNMNGQFVAMSPEFMQKKFRLLNKNTGLMQVFTLAKLISTTFRNSQFEYRGEGTGLKDKSGKDIYEGDVVKVYDQEVRVVEFKNAFWQLEDYVGENKLGGFGTPMDSGHKPMYRYPENNIEVIGNIYENKEAEMSQQ